MQSIDKKKLRHYFNKAAMLYDQHSSIQQQSGLTLIEQIKKYRTSIHQIIDLGCGTGSTTEKLAQAFHYQIFYAIDIADQLLDHAKSRLLPLGICVVAADFEEYNTSQVFDLAFANMALQWSSNLTAVFTRIYSMLENNGLLAFSIPLTGTLAELSNLGINPFFNSQQIVEFLQQAGYKKIDFNCHTLSSHFDSLHTALRSIKAVGANYVSQKKYGILGKSVLNQQQGFTLTYNLGYFIAEK
jgi:malonyl-CoA O-methyltransferase